MAFYTTGSIREKYSLDSYKKILPRLKKYGPSWLNPKFTACYKLPESISKEDHLIIYELNLSAEFNLPVERFEKDGHPYLVIKDNRTTIQLKLFTMYDGEVILLRDYDSIVSY